MKKMSTLFVVEYSKDNKRTILSKTRDENRWVFTDKDKVKATRKFDGTACMIKSGILYKRYDAKKGKTPPEGAIPCCEPDSVTGHHPHWVEVSISNPADKWHLMVDTKGIEDGTYELIGEKLQGNPEKIVGHKLVQHGSELVDIPENDWNFIGFEAILKANDIEGLVFHHEDGRMCKLRKSDYGIKR